MESDGSAHERMTVAMALAEVTHHTAPRGQKTATARGEERDELYDAIGLMNPHPTRPTPLVEVRPLGRVLRHVVDDLGEFAPMVQILDLPMPQMVDYVVGALRLLDFPIAEQVIDVPKISCSPCPSRSLVPEPQSADQLVEVPTVLSPLRIAEQIVGIPVRRGRVQGFLPEQGSTAMSSSGKRISERTVEQIVDISSSGGGLGQGASSSASPAGEDFTGGFRTFLHGKSAEYRAGGECAAGWARQLIHAERSSNASCRRRFALGLSGVGAVP